MSGQWLSLKTRSSGAAGSFLPLSGGTITGQLAINRGTLTALSPAIDITSTWNNAAVTFTGFRYNVTDTASNALSLLMDLQVGGASQFAFAKSGLFQMTQGANGFIAFGTGSSRVDVGSATASQLSVRINGNTRNVWSGFPSGVPSVSNGFGWHVAFLNLHNSTGSTTVGGFLTSEASNSISLVNSTNAQTCWVYNTYTSSTSFERLAVRWNSGVAWIDTQKGSGGGSAQPMVLGTDSIERLRLDVNGNVVVNTAAIATNATNGFLYVPSCAGTPTGVPTAYTGRIPIVVDTTNNKLYFYSNSAWRDAGP